MATSVQAGKIYKWTDASGEVHYTQTPPPDQHVQEMDVKVNAPKAGANTSGTAKQSDTKQKKDAKAPDAEGRAALEKKNEEARQENCKRANKRFRTINAGGRLYDVNEKGEREYWDDGKRASELDDAQKSVEKWCNK